MYYIEMNLAAEYFLEWNLSSQLLRGYRAPANNIEEIVYWGFFNAARPLIDLYFIWYSNVCQGLADWHVCYINFVYILTNQILQLISYL